MSETCRCGSLLGKTWTAATMARLLRDKVRMKTLHTARDGTINTEPDMHICSWEHVKHFVNPGNE